MKTDNIVPSEKKSIDGTEASNSDVSPVASHFVQGSVTQIVQCPEFPYFGASYPDARCIDGYLWDLDKCDDSGLYSSGDNPPCPFCNTEEFIKYHTDIDDKELDDMNNDNSLSDKDRQDILDTNRTKEDAKKLADSIKSFYPHQNNSI